MIQGNVQEIDEQYRAMEGLVSMEDIEKLKKIYKLAKRRCLWLSDLVR